MPKKLLIVYYSLTGGAEAMAKAVAKGASSEPDVEVQLLHATQANEDHVLSAAGYVFVCPEMLGSMSGLMKDFFERAYYPCLGQIQARPYSTLICAGSDGQGAVRQIGKIASGWRLKAICDPSIVCTHAQTPEEILGPKTLHTKDLKMCEELGETFAGGLAMGVF
ncbi:MAG: flavodoxin domain-containing protein [Limnobacter sp.]|nr:flavodoxin domain-containing protein [Limnobacter sp.]